MSSPETSISIVSHILQPRNLNLPVFKKEPKDVKLVIQNEKALKPVIKKNEGCVLKTEPPCPKKKALVKPSSKVTQVLLSLGRFPHC